MQLFYDQLFIYIYIYSYIHKISDSGLFQLLSNRRINPIKISLKLPPNKGIAELELELELF
jgi:hypothetical protein